MSQFEQKSTMSLNELPVTQAIKKMKEDWQNVSFIVLITKKKTENEKYIFIICPGQRFRRQDTAEESGKSLEDENSIPI